MTAAIAIAAAGLGGGIVYKKFREDLCEKKVRQQRKRKSKPSTRRKRRLPTI
jgi:hypothetical protein